MAASFDTATSWVVDFVEVDKLAERMLMIPGESEQIINETLQKKSGERATKTIISGMPISEVIRKIIGKKHAKESQSLNITHENLGFIIRPKKAFNYLKYPDLGIGRSIHNPPQEFMRKGMEKEIPVITDELNDALQWMIDKRLGGK